jgi:hypothetical protein
LELSRVHIGTIGKVPAAIRSTTQAIIAPEERGKGKD